ncbi:MAG: Crp/Fnr family transcriptional regulator [Candidatus Sericytochromatia bacterium]|nr:Crp/Fnr family transcriptional regulator [Candidatus Sericytochromatia bacterium]
MPDRVRDLAGFLKESPLFTDLDAEELQAIVGIARKRELAKNAIVFYESDPGTSCSVLLSGKVKIVVNSTHDGREHILGFLGPRDVFGEMSLIDGEPRSATAVAVEASEILILPREEFLSLLNRQPGIAPKLLLVLCRRLRQTDRHVESLAFLSAPGRVARLLLEMARESVLSRDEDGGFETRMTRQEMANRTGTSRETLTRVLMDYQDRGLIRIDRQRFVVRDEERLRALVV